MSQQQHHFCKRLKISKNMDIRRHLICPVCLAYPDKEVFQCHSGHPICSSCIQKFNNCPQCKLPFGIRPIRCLVMELMLDSVLLACGNENHGCTQVLPRKELSEHKKICNFRPVNFCKWLGCNNCNFKASTATALAAHLKSDHNIPKWNGTLVKKLYPADDYRTFYLLECAANSGPGKAEKTWFLLLLTLSLEPNGENCLACVPIHLHDGRSTVQHQVDLEVQHHDPGMGVYKWTGSPPNYKEAEKHILKPFFRAATDLNLRRNRKNISSWRFSATVKRLPSIQED